jgi:hypothetical protein
MLSNYFGKLPTYVVELLFGQSGLGQDATLPPPPDEGPDEPADPGNLRRFFFSHARQRRTRITSSISKAAFGDAADTTRIL